MESFTNFELLLTIVSLSVSFIWAPVAALVLITEAPNQLKANLNKVN